MKTLIIVLSTLFLTINSFAQNYYTSPEIAIDNDVIFGSRIYSGSVILTNKKDPVIDIPTDNLEIVDVHGIWRNNSKVNGNNTLLNAFYTAFTPAEIASIEDQTIYIYMDWDNNGNLVKIQFSFRSVPKMLSIPPSKFATLYRELKKNVKFKVTEPKLNYNTMIWRVKMSKVKNRELLFAKDLYY